MRLIIATLSINECIKSNIIRAVGTITIVREVSELPVKYNWIKEEAENELKSKQGICNNYQIGIVQSISDITDLIDFSEEEYSEIYI